MVQSQIDVLTKFIIKTSALLLGIDDNGPLEQMLNDEVVEAFCEEFKVLMVREDKVQHEVVVSRSSSVVFISNVDSIDPSIPLNKQIQVMLLPGCEDTTSALHQAYLQLSMCSSQVIKSSPTLTSGPDEDAAIDKQIPVVGKKATELEFVLRGILNKLDIPEIQLTVDPLILEALEKQTSPQQSLDEIGLGEEVRDVQMLNRLQHGVGKWTKEIQKVTKIEHETAPTVSQEVAFWVNLEQALGQIQRQVDSNAVKLTLDVLKQSRRPLPTIIFENDNGLSNALKRVKSCMVIFQDFPIGHLLAASSVEQIREALRDIFAHLKKIKSADEYPLTQACQLVEALSRDTVAQLLSIIDSQRLVQEAFGDFEKSTEACDALFKDWESHMTTFKEMLRDLGKRRGSNKALPSIRLAYGPLQERLVELRKFREAHEQFRSVVEGIFISDDEDDSTTLTEIGGAFKLLFGIDILDVSSNVAWEEMKKQYDRKLDRVEGKIIEKLTDRLANASTADEMFRVFSKFNALFFRSRILAAIQQFQSQLIRKIENDIESLQATFKKSYGHSQASLMSKQLDVPPVSGAIMWARQIDLRLKTYLERAEAVLGKNWDQHLEGRRLKETGIAFQKKLNTQVLYEHWLKSIQAMPNFELKGQLFVVNENRRLVVNFDPQIVELFKEVRNLQWLGYRVPVTISVIAEEAKEKYPYAMALKSALNTFVSSTEQADADIQLVLASHIREVQKTIETTFQKNPNWESTTLGKFCGDFCQRIYDLQQKINDVSDKIHRINKHVANMKTCELKLLHSTLDAIQGIIDEMNLASYTSLDTFTKNLETGIEKILATRLAHEVDFWLTQFEQGKLDLQTTHEIVLYKHALELDPPLEESRRVFIEDLHGCINAICELPRLQSSRYDRSESKKPFGVTSLLHDVAVYGRIEDHLHEVSEFVDTWLRYQALWDLDSSVVEEKVKGINMWHKLILDIQKARVTFETSQNSKRFGSIEVDYQQVQAQISLRYDAWQKELLQKFSVALAGEMKSFYQKTASMKQDLEAVDLTIDPINYVILMDEIKHRNSKMEDDLAMFSQCERQLQRHRMTFPDDWLWNTNIQGEWGALMQIYARRSKAMEEDLAGLQARVFQKHRETESKLTGFCNDWNSSKPVNGKVPPLDALNTLAVFETKCDSLDKLWTLAERARAVFTPGSNIATVSVLDPIKIEISGMKEVWSALSEVSQSLLDLKETPWTGVVPRKLRASIDALLEQLRNLPGRVRQYEAFEQLQSLIREYKNSMTYIVELRSESLKDRHWRKIMKSLGLSGVMELTLGDLWDADLKKHAQEISDVCRTAQGEMALEEFLRQIREYWTGHQLDLIMYQNRCRLIRGWDDLFAQLDEHTTSLQSMKQSPFFKEFEDETLSWEDKLNRIRSLLDIWIDVQRRWVYLGGILHGSADIKQQLPNEYMKFMTIDSDFVAIMNKVSANPSVMDVVAIVNEQALIKLATMLEKIQKALGEYLERQRQGFSRFYFVGDEDLLEIIGNTNDLVKAQQHFNNMFAGIASVGFEGSTIKSMISREGEEIPLHEAISTTGKVSDWLQKLENAMQETLRMLLVNSVSSSRTSFLDKENELIQWIEDTPSQIVLLAVQLAWSSKAVDLKTLEKALLVLASSTKSKKITQVLTELVHQRDVLRNLQDDFDWQKQLRYEMKNNELQLTIANTYFKYGYEYLGVAERLVQTPLTDRCYLALSQALHFRLGGNPFGPAGTGKTESVKALGAQLGRFVLVFNCDEHFDLMAMGRIFVGLCQVGAWGCFDEFNRLEERILSAVSEQILMIQRGLLEKSSEVYLIGKTVRMNPDVGIFVTMNPGYAGRSNLPDNLKQLFRSIAMIEPDRELIAQVMLYAQGFKSAEVLARKVVLLFNLCNNQLSSQSHYDFGLRAVKSVLVTAGTLLSRESCNAEQELNVLVKSLRDNIVPKLVSEDVPVFAPLMESVFPGLDLSHESVTDEESKLREAILSVCEESGYIPREDWVDKMLQLNRVQELQHGVMMVGPAGCGKSASWRVLLEAKAKVDGIRGESYIIDPKAVSKEKLYGILDPTTMEWTNGVFTFILRKILNNVRNERSRRHWIIFDGDVDPEWAENLNSVLDDNKLLTLPNGERLGIPDNVRIMFEVQSLKYATLATVSRCGMVWYSETVLSLDAILQRYGVNDKFVAEIIDCCVSMKHSMEVTRMQVVESFCALYRETNNVIFSLLWGAGGSMNTDAREELAKLISQRTVLQLPPSLWEFDAQNRSWKDHVPQLAIEGHRILDTSLVIPTVDTVRHTEILRAYITARLPVILCGPPGSGKTMSLNNVLSTVPNTVLASINFSSATTPEHILKTLRQHCVFIKKDVLAPPHDKWLVIFCDEVNLPAEDKYGTQCVISFMRLIIEQGGYWNDDCRWITLKNVQFVGACNPPTDPGRVPMNTRFLRHAPLIYVDYPARDSLFQIYGTFIRAMLKAYPKLRGYSDAVTESMIEFYLANKKQFSPDVAPQYVYSPRELSRWMRGIYEALQDDLNHLVKLLVHEGLRLFHDRLIASEEKEWCVRKLDDIVRDHFPTTEPYSHPIIFSNWLSNEYNSVPIQDLREHVEARLKVFYEEELNVPLVVFDDVLEHVLRIDRVLRQPLGHLLLVGKSGAGKTVLSRFVSWMNGIRVFQIKISRKYSLVNFDDDLRFVLKKAQEEKICFIFDESNILDSAFLERMNALLASGEVPGLFEEELPENFTVNVQRNLHVVFTMNPSSSDLKFRAATSPALFNRCVVDWFGDWSRDALQHVSREFTKHLDCDDEVLVDSLVIIHEEIVAKKDTYGPRDFLDLIHHFVSLYNEKRSAIEDEQLHSNVGLDKLRETSTQVEELNKSLLVKQKELAEKDKQANEKLEHMITDQNEAEKKKAEAEKLSVELEERRSIMMEQKAISERELGMAEPALIDAQKAVGDIRKSHLDEMRALANPPKLIKLTLEAVCIMLNVEFASWADIRRILMKREFIPDVVNFKSEELTDAQRHKVQALLDNNPDFVEEKVFNANRACVALFKWIVSQLQFTGILLKIQPLRDQIAKLDQESSVLQEKLDFEQSKIADLESKIGQYKTDYALLIKECENIKSEMSTVQTKVKRSVNLLSSLEVERRRWESNDFGEQMATLVGDVLVSAAFATYSGMFDYVERRDLLNRWRKIYGNDNFEVVSYLSKPSERMEWRHQKLPDDNICIENAIILKRFNRFPLMIDPSGQAVEFLLNHVSGIKKTSFLDGNFFKNLESALRFGTSLLVTDVENIDPILNPVLNREIHRAGGRTLVRLGDQDIDFSPSFNMFLVTRDTTFSFAPDLCSRVTFVNFSVTPASLQAQCLSRILKCKRPDIYEQHKELVELQGEYYARLRDLEKKLLDSISVVEGSILDNDEVINHLEKTKQEASEISEKSGKSQEVLSQLNSISNEFEPAAERCSSAFFTLVDLDQVHFTYQFSLEYFFSILDLQKDNFEVFPSKLYDRVRVSILKRDQEILASKMQIEEYDQSEISIDSVISSNTIVMILSQLDISNKVTNAQSVAMGSPEGYDEAEKLIDGAIRRGGTVMLKNIHLTSRDWLVSLEKKLFQIRKFDEKFRLVLTSEMSPILPKTLLQNSFKYCYEPPIGMGQSLLRALNNMPTERMNAQPVERSRLYFLLAWLHSIIIERLRYVPIGWSKKYEFNDADLRCAMDVIDDWVDGKVHHVAPEQLPWTPIKSLLVQVTYGGRLDNSYDAIVLQRLVDDIFHPRGFDMGPIPYVDTINFPEGTKKEHFIEFVKSLPNSTPAWLGLLVSDVYLTNMAEKRKLHLLATPTNLEDRARQIVEHSVNENETIKMLVQEVKNYLDLKQGVEHMQERTNRVFEEVHECFLKNTTPPAWRQYLNIANLEQYLTELHSRCQKASMELGDYLAPRAYLSTKRCETALSLNVPLDALVLLCSEDSDKGSDDGLSWSSDVMIQGSGDEPMQKRFKFAWKLETEASSQCKQFPLYSTSDRSLFLETVQLNENMVKYHDSIAIIANVRL